MLPVRDAGSGVRAEEYHFFSILAQRIIVLTGSERTAALALVYITFIGSMLIANDMALITFLPLGYFVFSVTDSKRDMAVVFILQNIAANLGGMLTPFGNPQNLYLYAHYHIANGEFVSIMFPPFAVSIALITLCCLLLPKRALRIQASQQGQRHAPAACAHGLLSCAVCADDIDGVPSAACLASAGDIDRIASDYRSQGAKDGGLSACC